MLDRNVKRLFSLLKNELVTGIVLTAPIAGTLWIVYAIVHSIDSLFPDEYRPLVLGHPLPGVGIISVIALALLVGFFAHNFIGRRLVDWTDRSLAKIPIFGGTYGLFKQVFESVFGQGAHSFQRAVLIEYPRNGIFTIAFVTDEKVSGVLGGKDRDLISVFVPTTPNPTSGFYMLVDKALVRDLDMPVETAFKIVISMGIAKEPEILTSTARMTREGDPIT
jgi:uncharacterized membrane protein